MIDEAYVDVMHKQRARICYHVAGDGPPVLLIHGWGVSWRLWQDTMVDLAQAGYRVYAPDNIGCGQSSKPLLAYTLSDYNGYIDAFIDALGLGRIIVGGHSLGGHLALSLALRRPQQVSRLVLVSPAFSPLRQMTPTRAELLLAAASLPLLGELALALAPRRLVRSYISQPWGGFYQPQRLPSGTIDRVVADYLDHATPLVCNTVRHLVVGALPGSRRSRYGTDLLPRVGVVSAPALLVWGQHDALLRPAAYRLLAERLPTVTTCVIADAGHSPQIEAPDAFRRALLAFVAAV